MPPPKKVPQTDAIFERLSRVNPQADRADDTLRISIDAKATVNVGPFSRRGRSRTGTKAADHDFKPEATLTPFGIFLPRYDDLWLYMACSKVTSEFIVDRLEPWWQEVRSRLITRKGYTDEELPTQQTINAKLNMLGYRLTKVAKCRPQKESSRPMPSSIV